ncbi:hypothetical protein [Actinomadura sp. HBU206391]|uniref:hypothetical protein n=1 Tax=Actinomadura sp. HBU206391 TaxID=2731692 RepID=UPI0016507FE8|nr:hypothetical protein [Actinomadura sp. HBU206391]MBC6463827.1 hypothetical protein [Actinomadura sp. HBU206391]
MLRKPPGVLFIGAVVAVCVYALGSSWTIGGTSEEYGFYLFIVLLIAMVAMGVRMFLALRSPRDTPPAAVVRISAGPTLLGITFFLLMLGGPERLRLVYSDGSLDDYARTVTAKECDEESFRPCRVGLYTVTCADRPIDSVVALTVRDRLTPDDTGTWFLVGPGDWEFGLQD